MVKVVRWSTKIILAKDLVSQKMTWGGFDATALSFCPYDNIDDFRYKFWKSEVEKHHKQQSLPNHYILDISKLPYKTEKELISIGYEAYQDIELDDYIKNDLGIYLTLGNYGDELKIVEFRVYENSKVLILDDDGEGR
jgi:hypothetical protein